MKDKVDRLLKEIENYTAASPEEVDAFRLKFLSKKGLIPDLFSQMRDIAPEKRKETGLMLNELKNRAQERLDILTKHADKKQEGKDKKDDLTKPANFIEVGTRHPISTVRNQIVDIFQRTGYTVSEGPEIEDDWHNFTALNFPEEHPARDMQDTFFIDTNPDIALRTHTSSVQIREMQKNKPPIRKIFPGRVFRNEAISARAHCIFHQVEGLYIDEGVSFADLKQSLFYFATELFGADTRIRFRPSYFPFTEPSAEMDISCFICGGKGCKICKYTGWVEILGCGMVDPNVLENCNIDHEKFTGFAFGMGIERITMLKYQIDDIRLFFENDIRFIKQFTSAI